MKNRFLAAIVLLMGSLLPVWGIVISFRIAGRATHWQMGHLVILAVPPCLEAMVIATAVLLAVGNQRLAKRMGFLTAMFLAAVCLLVIRASGEFFAVSPECRSKRHHRATVCDARVVETAGANERTCADGFDR